jgi:WD40 repeat protein
MKISKKILIIFLASFSIASSGLFAADSDLGSDSASGSETSFGSSSGSESGSEELRDEETSEETPAIYCSTIEEGEKTITFICCDGEVVVPLKSVIKSEYIRFLAKLRIDISTDHTDEYLIAAYSDDSPIDLSRFISVESFKRLVDEYLTPMANKKITSSVIKEKLEKENIKTLKEFFRVSDRLTIPFPTIYLGDFREFSEACISELIRKWINQRDVNSLQEFSNFLGHESGTYNYFSKNKRVVNALRKYVDRWGKIRVISRFRVAVSEDGCTVVTGSWDNTAKILTWNNSTYSWDEKIVKHHNLFLDFLNNSCWGGGLVAVSADGCTVVTGSQNRTTKILRKNRSTWDEKIVRHGRRVRSVAISADGGTVVTGATDNTAKILRWNSRFTRHDEHTVQHGHWVTSVAVSLDGGIVVTGSQDGTAKILRWNGRDWDEEYTVNHYDYVMSVVISGDRRTVVTVSCDNTTKIIRWDGHIWHENIVNHGPSDWTIFVARDGRTVFIGLCDNTEKILRWNGRYWDEEIVKQNSRHSSFVSVSSGGTYVTGSIDGTTKILRWGGRSYWESIIRETGGITSVELSPYIDVAESRDDISKIFYKQSLDSVFDVILRLKFQKKLVYNC